MESTTGPPHIPEVGPVVDAAVDVDAALVWAEVDFKARGMRS